MRKFLTLAVLSLFFGIAAQAQAVYIWGSLGTCVGNTTTLYGDTMSTGGTWTSGNPAVATVGASTGIVTAVSAGTSVITYAGSTGTATAVYTVSPLPAAITGGGSAICPGTTTTLATTTTGGTWSADLPWVATVGAGTGVVTGVGAGVTNIFYSTGYGCRVATVVTVISTPVDSIDGPSIICVGGTGTFSNATTGGTWSISPSTIASISSTGVVSGITAGSATVSYTVTGVCGTVTRTVPIFITSGVGSAMLAGPSSVNEGAYISLWASVAGGTWSSSSSSIASVSSLGVVTGVSGGTATISYTTPGCSSPMVATKVITVNPFGGISGHVLFSTPAFYGPVKVWLIKYDATTMMLTACDSQTVYSSGSSAFYQFWSPASGDYRVKAHAIDSTPSTTGYIPTYHTSAFYWSSATVIPHVATVADINKDINMAYGTTTSGPGFIAGNVTAGANKGTATSVPAVGLLIYAVNPATGNVIQHTYTDASGNYSFSNLPVGQSYRIYPELINYETTPFPLITLTSGTTSMTAANFEQRTVSHKIVPIVTGVSPLTIAAPAMYVYPNPSVNQVNIEVNAAQPENGTLVITDVMGREQYRQDVQSNGHFAQTLDVTRFAAGVYFISYDAGTSHYKQTISIKH